MRKRLIALRHILFEAHQYKPGEELPAHNHDMVEAWLENGVAKWDGGEETPPEEPEIAQKAPKRKERKQENNDDL